MLYAVSRINRGIGAGNRNPCVYASTRSEIMQEINRIGPEIYRDVSDFGADVIWNTKASSLNQPILKIVESKIHSSETEFGEPPTKDIWDTYIPARILDRSAKQYLLDISMHRPRGLVRRLTLARDFAPSGTKLTSDAFKESASRFSSDAWREVEEDLLATYDPRQVSAIKTVLSGFKVKFTVTELKKRIQTISDISTDVKLSSTALADISRLLGTLYRVGAIGNQYNIAGKPRNGWVFRDEPDPLPDKPFVVHESLRRALRLE